MIFNIIQLIGLIRLSATRKELEMMVCLARQANGFYRLPRYGRGQGGNRESGLIHTPTPILSKQKGCYD